MVAFPGNATFNPRDVREQLRPLIRPWIENQAWCAIIDPTQKITKDDPITGIVNDVKLFPLYTGWMRVQPLRTDNTVKKAVNSTTQRVVQFWPLDFPGDSGAEDDIGLPFDLKPGLEVIVIDGGNDPNLEMYKYLVIGSLNSSMAWQRTITTVVDEESRPNYEVSQFPQKPVT